MVGPLRARDGEVDHSGGARPRPREAASTRRGPCRGSGSRLWSKDYSVCLWGLFGAVEVMCVRVCRGVYV